MNAIYVYDGLFKHGDAGFDMIKGAAARYCEEIGQDFDMEKAEILRDERGKPYFTDMPVEFSLTHSGKLWMCLFSDSPCGLDLQIVKDCDYKAIAKRYFFEDEQEYIEENGLNGFFDIWVRKEAYCKMTGTGMFGDMPSVMEPEGTYKDVSYCFMELPISDDLKCAVCSGDRIEVEMRILG